MRAVALTLTLALAACQPSPEELWLDAERAGQAGDYAEAAIHLKNLLEQDPDNVAARTALGTAALALGDPASAEKELRRAITLGGESSATRYLLVEALLAQTRFAQALEELDTSTDTTTQAVMLAGRAREGLGQLSEAEANYRQAMAASPGDPAPLVAMAGLYLATRRGGEADVLLDKALLLDPSHVPAMVLKGRRLLDSRGPAEAETWLRQALGQARSRSEEIEVLVSLADVQFVRNDAEAATETVSRLERLAPGSIPTRYLRARLQAQSGDYAEAILGLQRIMNEAPGFLPAERLLGTVHYLNGNLEQAAMHISRVIGESSGDPFMARLLAELRLQQDRPEQALQTLLPMIRQSPGAAFEQGLLALAGQASLRLGDSEAALGYFRRGAEQYPDNESFRLGEISARLASGDTATARLMLESLRASSTNPLALDYLSVMTYLIERDTTNATILAERLARENADAPWSHLLLATVYAAAGRPVDARREFDIVIELDPFNKEGLLNLARLDYQEGNAPAGEERLRRVILQHPSDYRPRMLLAEAMLVEQRFDEALEQARQAARLGPDSAATLNLLGRAAAAAGKWGEARDSFNRITALDPDNARAWLNLARATVASGQNASLPDSLQKAMELAPRDPAVLVTAGDLLMELRRPSEAMRYFEGAYAVEPRVDVAIRACRAALAIRRDNDCSELDNWIARNPADVVGRLFIAAVHQSRNDFPRAMTTYERIIELEPRQPVALNNLAWLYFESGDERALAIAERALEVQPDSASVMDTLGWIETKRGDPRRGLTLLTNAAKRASDPDIHFHLAFALAESGDIAGAREALAPTLATARVFPSRAEAEQLMRRLAGVKQDAGG